MAPSFSFATYLHNKRKGSESPAPPKVRPEGKVVWAHATEPHHFDALRQLEERLRSYRSDVHLLLTHCQDVETLRALNVDHAIHTKAPDETIPAVEEFLDAWRPDYALWTAGDLRPTLIEAACRRRIPIGLIAADENRLARPSWRWLRDAPRALFRKFDFILTRDVATQRYLERARLGDVDIAVGGELSDGAINLPYNESDREEMSNLLLGRPVWLSAHLDISELSTVLAAHRDIIRYSHRALLIVVPEKDGEAQKLLPRFEESQLRTLCWSEGDLPDESTQVVFADVPGELGLWYRLAPITFMGNSLFPGMAGSDPNQPAAHGSAILHGPHTDRFASNYIRFTEANAARQITEEKSLADAVKRLLPADQCAVMAHAAWEVSSRGAALTDRVAERILDFFDRSESKR